MPWETVRDLDTDLMAALLSHNDFFKKLPQLLVVEGDSVWIPPCCSVVAVAIDIRTETTIRREMRLQVPPTYSRLVFRPVCNKALVSSGDGSTA